MIAASHELHWIRAPEDVGAVRRAARRMAEQQQVSRAEANRAELVATEIGSNLVHHVHDGGYVLLRPLHEGGIEVIGVDSGPGIDDVTRALRGPGVDDIEQLLREGRKRMGLGVGLSSLTRLADEFDIHTQRRCGTVVLARIRYGAKPQRNLTFRVGGVSVPIAQDGNNGDGWAWRQTPCETLLFVVDGLGHGLHAKFAAEAALHTFEHYRGNNLIELFAETNEALRTTRGAAASACRILPDESKLQFVGAGNVEGRVFYSGRSHALVPDNGTLGIASTPPKIHLQEYAWRHGATLLLHSDGVRAHLDTSAYAGLLGHDPAAIAAALYRDCRRNNDDASAVVLEDLRGIAL
jgi:anti-sigma regulatory factor (Ser/Thr protein kinase)